MGGVTNLLQSLSLISKQIDWVFHLISLIKFGDKYIYYTSDHLEKPLTNHLKSPPFIHQKFPVSPQQQQHQKQQQQHVASNNSQATNCKSEALKAEYSLHSTGNCRQQQPSGEGPAAKSA